MHDFIQGNMFPDRTVGQRVDQLDKADGLGNSGEQSGALIAQGLFEYRFRHPERIRAPVLIVAGGKDFQAAIEPQRKLARALRRARLLEYPDNGHFMFVENPQRFARDVTRFMKSAVR